MENTKEPPSSKQDNIPPELNTLISEEVLRARVIKIIETPKPQPWPSRLIGHQLFAIAFGFALTGLIGSCLTKQWEESRLETTRKIEQERRETDARITAFTDFLGTVAEQHTRSSLVDEAFKNGASGNELAILIRSEQEVFARYQNKIGVLTFSIRQLVEPEKYDRIRRAMENGLIQPLRQAVVNHGYMFSEMTNRRISTWKSITGLSPQLSICSAALTDAIWYNAIAPPEAKNGSTTKEAESLRQMDETCKSPNQ